MGRKRASDPSFNRFCSSSCSNKSNGIKNRTNDPEAQFWQFVQKSTEPDGCWIWKGSMTRGGYGHFVISGKHYRAHRAAWIFTNGEIPKGLNVLHKCDNPPCVNPEHLFTGTLKDNAQDMLQKGRYNYNKKNTAYLTFQGITKRLYEWAEEFSIKPPTLARRIKKGLSVEEALTTPVKNSR